MDRCLVSVELLKSLVLIEVEDALEKCTSCCFGIVASGLQIGGTVADDAKTSTTRIRRRSWTSYCEHPKRRKYEHSDSQESSRVTANTLWDED